MDTYAREDRGTNHSWSRRWKPVQDATPELRDLTQEQQDELGHSMGLPHEQRQSLIKRKVLTLPQTPLCQAWAAWATHTGNLPSGADISLMEPAEYQELVQLHAISGAVAYHTPKDQDDSINKSGSPIPFWQTVMCTAEQQ